MRRPIAAILVTIAATAALIATLCLFGDAHETRRIDVYKLDVRDVSLLTPEQQRVLVRNGEVTVSINGVEVTLHNDESIRPYLNEGGIR